MYILYKKEYLNKKQRMHPYLSNTGVCFFDKESAVQYLDIINMRNEYSLVFNSALKIINVNRRGDEIDRAETTT